MKIWQDGLADVFIFVDIPQLAQRVSGLLSDSERENVIGVGRSGMKFAGAFASAPTYLAVQTEEFCVVREKRRLRTEGLEVQGQPVLVDDIAVSGLTLAMAKNSVTPQPATAAVGMLYRSKTTRRRTGFNDIRAGFQYCRYGGGNPPINSVETLLSIPERLNMLVGKYFDYQNSEAAKGFKQILRGEI